MSRNDYSDISNYSFQKDIGEGNFGKVKLGIFKPTGEEFAIKILNKHKIKIKMKNSIFKENEIITRFNHINVVYVFQILEDSQNFYIIMEYCKHGELFDYIVKNERLTEEESSIFFYQLINGIEYIHSKGISHRDLKPENLLLAENKILKIIDFGLSHEFEGDELLKTKCGSPSYAAPEIICCPFYDGFKVDIWCCGIILYAMLCGYLPFEGDDNNLLFQNILNCDPELPEFLSDLSKNIILQILNPSPDTRITIDEIKKHKFYLKGKKLCKIDYDNIENNIIKKRDFAKNKNNNINIKTNIVDNNDLNIEKKFGDINESDLIENNNDNYKDINRKNEKDNYINTVNNNIKDTKYNYLLNSNSNEIINPEINNEKMLKEFKNESISSNNFKKKIMDINTKYNNRIEAINNKIQRILKTDANDNIKMSIKPFSSNKKINTNRNIVSLSNNSNTKMNNNSKPGQQYPFFNLISETKENNSPKGNALFIKLLDSVKNKYFTSYKTNSINKNEYNLIKTKSKRQNINISNPEKNKNKETKMNKTPNSFFKNFKNNAQKININIADNNSDNFKNYIISLSNDNLNLNDIENQIQTCKNKKSQRFNIFKKKAKAEKTQSNHYFNIKKALAKHATNIDRDKYKINNKKSTNQSRKNSLSVSKAKQLNLYVPNSTLYYNNININIKEVNINNPRETKNMKNIKNNTITSFTHKTKKIKNPSQTKKCSTYRYYYNSKNRIDNKASSAKRLFTYNIYSNDIRNLKTNINSINHTRKNSNNNININKINKINNKTKNNNNFNENNNLNNLYRISNNTRHYFMNTLYNNDINFNYNYNIISTRKTPKYNSINNNNMKFTQSEKNINYIKENKILSAEPKEIIKKQFSFNSRKKKNNLNNQNKLHTEMNTAIDFSKDIKRRSRSNKIIKSKTINTEVRGDKKYINEKNEGMNHDFMKKFGKKYQSNNIDKMLLYMFIKQKNNGKNYNQNSFRNFQ